MNMTAEEKNRAIGMWGLALCMLALAAGWMFLRFGVSWSMADLPESEHIVRIVPAYIIAEIAVIPLGAKLADLWGVKRILLFGPIIFIVASVLCTISVNAEMLVAFRFVEGIGGGLLLGMIFTAVGRYYAPDKRNKCHELMTAAFAFGSLFGSAAGYYLTDTINWRAGYVALAVLMLVGMIMAWKKLPHDEGSHEPIDYLSLVLVTVLFGVAAYYTQSVNVDYDLLSLPSLFVVIVIVALLILTMWVCRRSSSPLIPVRISTFEKKLILLMFLFSMCGLGLIQYYFKLYLTFYEFDIYTASFNFMFLILGAAGPSLIGCRKVIETGVRPWVTIGGLIVTAALIMTHFLADQGTFYFILCLFVFGFGLGMIVTEIIISLQSITPRKDMGLHTGNLMAVRMIGILVGNAVVGSYIRTVVNGTYQPTIIDISSSNNLLADLANHFSSVVKHAGEALNMGFSNTVLIMAVVTAILAIIAYTLRKYDLENRKDE